MGTKCSKCEFNYQETQETVNAIRGHLEREMSYGFHMDTVWKTALAIGAAQLVVFILYKVYKKWQKAKTKKKQRAKMAQDFQNSVYRISRAEQNQPPPPPIISHPISPNSVETGETGNSSMKAIQDLAMILKQQVDK